MAICLPRAAVPAHARGGSWRREDGTPLKGGSVFGRRQHIYVRKAVPLGRHAPLALQPTCPPDGAVAQLHITPLRPLVVVAHLLGADAPDFEVLGHIRVRHDVDVPDLLVPAHLAGGVVSLVRWAAVSAQVDDVRALPPLVDAPG